MFEVCDDLIDKIEALKAKNKKLRAKNTAEVKGLNRNIDDLIKHRDILLAENAQLVAALQKIANPKKYHHLEPDDYTQNACFIHVANECLDALGKET